MNQQQQYQQPQTVELEANEFEKLLEGTVDLSQSLKPMPESFCSLFPKAPVLAEGEFLGYETAIKCNRQSKTWHHMHIPSIQKGEEFLASQVESIVLSGVKLQARPAAQMQRHGCSLIRGETKVIGYATGRVVVNYVFNRASAIIPIKYDGKQQTFTDFEGRPVSGAEVLLLDENCKAVAVNPVYA